MVLLSPLRGRRGERGMSVRGPGRGAPPGLERPRPCLKLALLAVGCMTMVACGDGEGRGSLEEGSRLATARAAERPPAAAVQELPSGVTPEMVQEGERIFVGSGFCHNCHGRNGRGLPQLGSDLTDGGWQHNDGSYEGLVERIGAGVPAERSGSGVPMPPAGGARLTPEQIRAVAAYVWTLSR